MSIEEDVKRCKELIKIEHANWIGMSNQSAISNVLAEREQDKKRIKELEEENRIFALEGCKVRLELYIKENYIPKQKIKDLMEKENLPLTIVGGRRNKKTLEYGMKLGRINAYKELLQESEDK